MSNQGNIAAGLREIFTEEVIPPVQPGLSVIGVCVGKANVSPIFYGSITVASGEAIVSIDSLDGSSCFAGGRPTCT